MCHVMFCDGYFNELKYFNNYCHSFIFPLACNSSCYNVLPSSDIIYANIGDSFDIIVKHSELVSFDLYKESNEVFDIAVCNDSNICVIHNDTARFEIKSFQPSLAGTYEYRYNFALGNSSFCATSFTIGELSYTQCKFIKIKVIHVHHHLRSNHCCTIMYYKINYIYIHTYKYMHTYIHIYIHFYDRSH